MKVKVLREVYLEKDHILHPGDEVFIVGFLRDAVEIRLLNGTQWILSLYLYALSAV